MAIIPYPDPVAQSDEVKARLQRLGGLNVTRMMSHNEPLMEAYARLGTTILLKGELDPLVREAVILRIGQLCDSEYEWHQHVSVARSVGMDDEQIAAIQREDFAALPHDQQAALRVAEEIHRDAAASKSAMAAAKEIFTTAQLIELTIVAGYYIMTAGYLRSLGIEIEDTPPLAISDIGKQ
jgi:4-carboxymuconolactone decarboxylase